MTAGTRDLLDPVRVGRPPTACNVRGWVYGVHGSVCVVRRTLAPAATVRGADREVPSVAEQVDPTAELPLHVRRLWRLDTGGSRGPRPALSVDAVVDAAVAIADADGLEAVSMARVAKQLGFTTMALYRHVDGKDELLQLMMDAAAGEPPRPPVDAGWRAAVLAWADELLALYRRHPWAIEVPIAGIPIGPNHLAWMEAGLAALRDSGLTRVERVAVVSSLMSYVRADVSLARQLAARHADRPWHEVEREHGRLLAAVVDHRRFPELGAVLAEEDVFAGAEGGAGAGEVDTGASFGLALLLEGIAAHVAGRDAPAADDR
ncbi:TetR/AcrR family transcriptional regulator [Nitriliruptoraceae bacterium ZYF776]|nr:TetR/AcrR family transcriptional regulator [Profundirhabdus halotolerans]